MARNRDSARDKVKELWKEAGGGKAPKETQQKEQKDIEERFKKNGAEYYIVQSVEEVKKVLAL